MRPVNDLIRTVAPFKVEADYEPAGDQPAAIKDLEERIRKGEKSMYGKKFMGIKRTTVLINPKGKIIKIWNNVKVKDHAKEVLSCLKEAI